MCNATPIAQWRGACGVFCSLTWLDMSPELCVKLFALVYGKRRDVPTPPTARTSSLVTWVPRRRCECDDHIQRLHRVATKLGIIAHMPWTGTATGQSVIAGGCPLGHPQPELRGSATPSPWRHEEWPSWGWKPITQLDGHHRRSISQQQQRRACGQGGCTLEAM